MSYFADLALQHVDGVWRQGSGAWDIIDFDPYSGEKLASVTVATESEIDDAFAAAERARPAWAAAGGHARREVLERVVRLIEERGTALAGALTAETGTTRSRAEYELRLARECLRDAGALAVEPSVHMPPSPVEGKENHVLREPAGVVCAITPFHHPFLRALATVAPALALGNTVVLKPHQSTPVAGGTLLAHLLEEAGLPGGVLNVVITDIAEIGDALLAHPTPGVIAYAGSERTGREVAAVAAGHFKRCVLDVSGGGPFIVLDDADVRRAAEAACFSRLVHQGQGGGAPASRVLVDRAVEREFTEAFTALASALVTGDPRDPATRVGPLVSPAQAESTAGLLRQAVAGGAVALVPGGTEEVDGALLRPTVLGELPEDAALLHQEVHGPVALVLPFKDEDEAVRLASRTPYGSGGAVHTRDLSRGLALAHRLEGGAVQINGTGVPDEPLVGRGALEAFTKVRWLSVQHGRSVFPF
ncbi:aldehyde dehydrogenase family protein [Streptomyces iconiensis]|uniref:Aldehyde dehydrogenase family protein n=1 Tax=Streptomyces iconiensis TaxID=1384038 RepID=A0ABT7A815_9ACTN|nr:aldehyde dehydrogenase family protein [Streptomyces iconiensis]MDJ1137202.1 aldehyde dehydrogenase family protein [Streptomyces iconiensis]